MKLSANIWLVAALLALTASAASGADGDFGEPSSSDRLDDFSDISLDDNESEPSADLSQLSDDEFLAGDVGDLGGGGGGQRPGELPGAAAAADKSALMMRAVAAALRRPGMTQRFGQFLPILRVMSPPQRLALVSLVMQQAMVPKDVPEPPLEMAMRLGATPDGSSNLTSQLLLPLSADVAHIFRGAGLEQAAAEGAAGGAGAAPGRGSVPAQGRSAGGPHPYRTQPQMQPPPPRWRGPAAAGPGGAAAAMPPSLHGPRPPLAVPAAAAAEGPPSQRPQRRHGDPDRLPPLSPPPPGINRRNAHVPPSTDMRPPPLPGRTSSPTTLRPFSPTTALTSTTPLDRGDHHGCSLFSDTVCESVERYPEDAILASIHADKHTVDALLADKSPPGARSAGLGLGLGAHGGPAPVEMQRRQDDDYPSDSPQDLDGQDGGVDDTHLCPSVIKYARPQRARATSGQWKYIVNTAEHTQTLRLEKCSRVEEPCNYLSDKVRSHCAQVYNYHRLLTWDKELGLHMDIFKVPTCCSCQVIKSPFLTSNSLARRPGLGLPGSPFVPHQSLPAPPQYQQQPLQPHQQHLQPVADFSHTQETVVVAESGRPVHPQYALKPFNQPAEDSRRDSASKASAAASSKPNWPFRKPATRRPPLQGHPQGVPQGHGHGPQYGLQTLEESPAPGEQLPQYPPLSPHNEYEYTPHRRAASVRNRTRVSASSEPLLDDLAAEGTQRRPAPVILTPEGHPVRVPASVTATSKRPLPPVLPPRLETYRPRATTAAATATPTTAAPATSAAAPIIIPTTAPAPGAPSTPTPKRVNYSYHPIIDFFRPLEKQMTAAQEPRNARPPPSPPQPQALQQRQEEVAEQRTAPDDSPLPGPSWSAQQSDWSPITRTVTPRSR